MSPLWADQIQVYFAPERVDFVRFVRTLRTARGFKSVQMPKITNRCDQQDNNTPNWELPMQQLDQMLHDASGTDMTITISNHFVRYVTLPPQAEISTPDEVYAYAAFRMREIYSNRVDAWALSVGAWDPIDGAICAALPKDLLAKFQTLADQHKIKLKGVEPYFASVYDRWHKALEKAKVCVTLIENGRICIALLNNGVWQSIRNQRAIHDIHDMKEELRIALDQEVILSGNKQADVRVYLFAPEHPDLILPEDCGWQVTALQTEQIQIPVPAHYPSPIDNHTEHTECVA